MFYFTLRPLFSYLQNSKQKNLTLACSLSHDRSKKGQGPNTVYLTFAILWRKLEALAAIRASSFDPEVHKVAVISRVVTLTARSSFFPLRHKASLRYNVKMVREALGSVQNTRSAFRETGKVRREGFILVRRDSSWCYESLMVKGRERARALVSFVNYALRVTRLIASL